MTDIVDLDAASVAPSPEPAPVAEPVADTPDYQPDWLNDLSSLMDNPNQNMIPEPAYYQPPPAPYYPQPPQYYQPPPPPPAPPQMSKGDLDFLLENPREYIAQVASMATSGQQQYVRQMEAQVSRLMDNTAKQTFNQAAQAVADGYKNVLNRDNTFKGNENVRRQVDALLQRAMGSVYQGISRGNFHAGAALKDPAFFPALLYTAKLKAGVGFRGSEAMPPAGATMEYVTSPVQSDAGRPLDPDLQLVADALGPAYAKQLREAVAEADKLGDMIW
jgi:hypothetical protein